MAFIIDPISNLLGGGDPAPTPVAPAPEPVAGPGPTPIEAPPPPPRRSSAQTAALADRQRRQFAQRRGRAGTLLTGSEGVPEGGGSISRAVAMLGNVGGV